MRIRRVSIRNFRNLHEVDVYPSTPMMILVGENDAGKSNFIMALRLLFDSQSQNLHFFLSEEDINYIARKQGHHWFSIVVEIGELEKYPKIEVAFRERIDQDNGESFVTIEGRYEQNDEGDYSWKESILSPKGRSNDSLPLSRRMKKAIPLYYLDAIRDASRDTRTTGRSPLAKLLTEFDFDDVQDEVQEHLKNANTALGKGRDVSQLASDLTSQLTPHIRGGQSEVTIAIADEETSSLIQGIRLNIRKTGDPNAPKFDLARHGTGLQNLALISIFRYKVISEQKKESRPILAIEEPEAHLHPHAQRQLFDDLRSIDAPVLMTTHSPTIVTHANPLSLIRFHASEPSKTKSYQLQNMDEGTRKDLSKLMRGGRSDVFFASSIIAVEGQCELITFSAFANVLGHELDREGVSVVEVQGNSYAFIVKPFQKDQFGIPVTVVYDTDALGNNSNSLVKDAYKAGLVSDTDLNLCSNNDEPMVAEKRRAVLTGIGWIGAERNFEEEVCKHGYLNIVLEKIDEIGSTPKLDRFLRDKGLKKDAIGVASYISNATRPKLKVPVAHAVARAVSKIGTVPPCYVQAIEQAMGL